jgi:hypothetical protein
VFGTGSESRVNDGGDNWKDDDDAGEDETDQTMTKTSN